ncbi:unnamed protein product [Phyllotreta striolata]|uniref:Uncharacterized protein n=1 Tax=Phyllotreta striolata TaxID=444603 RepID=A0A9N9XUW2_PHYSR|nr:unnamed protein product [Phyllotreta striolata]
MEWMSKNVPKGGMLQTPKNSFDPDRAKYLKLLIEESKMASMMRKKENYNLRSDEEAPESVREPKYPVTIRPGSSKKRSMQTIVESGVYERERFKPARPAVDREKEKEKLQNKMAYNSEIKFERKRAIEKRVRRETAKEPNRFDQLVEEIKERENWLKDMERLGEADKYRQVIENQIQEKIRLLNRMKSCDDVIID